MNQIDDVKHLAKSCNEALEVVTERKCLECDGTGEWGTWCAPPRKEKYKCNACSGTGKVRWKWKPEPGEWGLTDYDEVVLIVPNWDEKSKKNCPVLAISQFYGNTACVGPDYHEVGIPILPWETIERVLEGVGCEVFAHPDYTEPYSKRGYYCVIKREKGKRIVTEGRGKSRTIAVYEAVIALGKEMGKSQ